MPPVGITAASPGLSVKVAACPISISPITENRAAEESQAPKVSSLLTAYPSTVDLANGGKSSNDFTASEVMRPTDAPSPTHSSAATHCSKFL